MKKVPKPMDKHVGSRVRMRRLMLGLSQEKLGDALGLTFQQVQKYEKGTNRIGASRLSQIGEILSVPVEFFFEGGPMTGKGKPAQTQVEDFTQGFLSTNHGLKICKAMGKMTEAMRHKFVALAEQVVAEA